MILRPDEIFPHGAGRPPIVETPEELRDKAREYLIKCVEADQPPTIGELVLFLGYADRSSLRDAAKRGDNWAYWVARIRSVIAAGYEAELRGPNVNGAKFALQALDNWIPATKQETQITPGAGGSIKIVMDMTSSQDNGDDETPDD